MQIGVSFLWAIYTAAIAPSTVRRANSQMNIRCTAAVHIAFALTYTQTLVTNVASYCGYIGPQYSYMFIFQSSESAM